MAMMEMMEMMAMMAIDPKFDFSLSIMNVFAFILKNIEQYMIDGAFLSRVLFKLFNSTVLY